LVEFRNHSSRADCTAEKTKDKGTVSMQVTRVNNECFGFFTSDIESKGEEAGEENLAAWRGFVPILKEIKRALKNG
jgi:hypothetical protein